MIVELHVSVLVYKEYTIRRAYTINVGYVVVKDGKVIGHKKEYDIDRMLNIDNEDFFEDIGDCKLFIDKLDKVWVNI